MKSLLSGHEMTKYNESFTASEIKNQPATWKRVWEKIQKEADQILAFLKNIQNKSNLNIVLTGAGSSAFIGEVVTPAWLKTFSCSAQAIPTTSLVTHFEEHILLDQPLFLISFGRSGNSPESKAVIEIANKKCRNVYHLSITCNPEGQLAKMGDQSNCYSFLLPEEAEDQSLAMTNSFTSMALAAMLIPKIFAGEKYLDQQVELMSAYGKRIIKEFSSTCQDIIKIDFDRIIFLGSGPLWGIAKESHLKVQELTNGTIIGKFDSFLGFRHGPKAILNDKTLLVYLLSNDEKTTRYEKDLIRQIKQHDINLTTLGVAETNNMEQCFNFSLHVADKHQLREEFWAIICTLPAQIIGSYKSLALGYSPDNPSPEGTISRVVEGVKIYNDKALEADR